MPFRIKDICTVWPPIITGWTQACADTDSELLIVLASNVRESEGLRCISLSLGTKSGLTCMTMLFFRTEHSDLLSRANARICARLGNALSEVGYLIADD